MAVAIDSKRKGIILTDLLTEQEQIQQLKIWAKIYGIPALIGVIAGIIIFSGWHAYQNYRLRLTTKASEVYDEMLLDKQQHNLSSLQTQADKLIKDYHSTVYSDMAGLSLAQEAVIQKNYPAAADELNKVLKHSGERSTRQIVRLRIARLQLAQQNPKLALETLATVNDDSFISLIQEVRGDAYLALQDLPKARASYQEAIKSLPQAQGIRPVLEMKLDNLP